MKRLFVFLTAALLGLATPALADIEPVPEEDEGVGGVKVSPLQAGRLEVVPILSVRFSGNAMVYRAGASVGYSLSRTHQLGGTFVMGNRVWERGTRREVLMPALPQQLPGGTPLSIDDGFGASATAFYRYNFPYPVEKRTYPFIEVFGGRDYWGWGDVSEVGAGTGVRKFLSRRAALTTQYAFSVLFAGGQRFKRHVVTAGVAMLFR